MDDASASPLLIEARERFFAAVDAVEESRRSQGNAPKRVFPPVLCGLWKWKGAVANALEQESEGLKLIDRARVRRRAKALRFCGNFTKVRVCNECDAPRAGSGVTCPPEGGFPCKARSCPFCERRRSMELAGILHEQVAQVPERARARAKEQTERIEQQVEEHQAKANAATSDYAAKRQLKAIAERRKKLSELRAVEKYEWRFITLTVEYDPYDPEQMTVKSLRERVQGLNRAMQHLWDEGLNRGGLGCNALFSKLEMSHKGFVHLHGMYYGGFVPKDWFESTAREAYEDCGFSWLERVADGDESGCIREVAKYVTKSAGPMCEDWLAGEERWTLHPVLAARWEIATLGEDVLRRYGVLRGLPDSPEESEENEEDADALHDGSEHPEDDAKAICSCCGSVGTFRTELMKTRLFVHGCHIFGGAALWGSKWGVDPRACSE